MSKSNDDSKNSFIDYQAFFDYFAKCLTDTTKKIEAASESMDSFLRSSLDREVAIKNAGKMTQAEIRKSISNITSTLDEMGIEFGKEGKKFVRHIKDTAIAESKRGDLSFEQFKRNVINVALPELFIKEQKAQAKGVGSTFIKNFSNSSMAKDIAEEINKKLGLASEFNSFRYKMEAFFGKHYSEAKKNLKSFGEDLIEGLSKNKFVGGALHDTFRLIGLIGGRWLSQFGQLGKILGASFYIAMEAFGPKLAGLIVKGLGNVIGKAFLGLGKTVWSAATMVAGFVGNGLGNLSAKGLGSIAELGTAVTRGEKVLAAGKVAGGIGGGALGLGGAYLAGKEAVKDWKSGHRGRATSFGIGAGFLGAGGIAAIASLFTAVAAPFVAPLLAIGVAIAGLTALWKKYGDNVKQWFGKVGENVKKGFGKVGDFLKGFSDFLLMFNPVLLVIKKACEWYLKASGVGDKIKDWVNNIRTDGKSVSPEQQELGENATIGNANAVIKGGKSRAQLLKGKTNASGHLDLKKMTEEDWQKADTLQPVYGSMGEILNLGQMSKKRAQAVVEADIKAKGNKSFYEALDEKLIDKGSFGTDIPYAARGTSAKVKHFLEKMEEQGFDTSNAKITSAIGTLGSRAGMSPHAYKDTPEGHFSSLGTTVDITALRRKDGHRLNEADMRAAGFGDYYLYNKGKGHETHEHLSFRALAWQLQAVEDKKEQQKVQAEQHSIDAGGVIYNTLGKEELNKITTEGNKHHKTPEEMGKLYEEKLKEQGVYQRSDKAWIQNKGDGSSVVLVDPHGNRTFENFSFLSKGANLGFE